MEHGVKGLSVFFFLNVFVVCCLGIVMSHLKPEGERKEKHHPSIYIGVSWGWNIGVCIESPDTRLRKCARRKKKERNEMKDQKRKSDI